MDSQLEMNELEEGVPVKMPTYNEIKMHMPYKFKLVD